jgi:hypothetical protein
MGGLLTLLIGSLPELIRNPALHLWGTAAALHLSASSLTTLPFGSLPFILLAAQRRASLDVMRAAEVIKVDVDPQLLLCEVLA